MAESEASKQPVREYLRTADYKPPRKGVSPAGHMLHLLRMRERYASDPEWRARKMAENRERNRVRREKQRLEKLALVEARRAIPLRAGRMPRMPRTQPAPQGEGEGTT